MKKVRYYSSFSDDFEQSANQTYTLPKNYKWVRTDIISNFLSGLIYGLAVIFGGLYCRCFLHMKVIGRKKLKGLKGDYFIYGNHTQPVGDVFLPALAAFPRRIYTVVSPANLDLPVLGRLLPHLGALPLPGTLKGLRALEDALRHRCETGHPIAIYPEAHVWPYYTGVRPFSTASFYYPVRMGVPAYTATAVYRKRPFGRKPRLELYVDGPFLPTGEGQRQRAESLCRQVREAMEARCAASDCTYIEYRKRPT